MRLGEIRPPGLITDMPGPDPAEVRSIAPSELLGPLNPVELKHSPKRLFVAGPLHLPLPHPRVAVIGTRTPTPKGLLIATEVSRSLAEIGAIVVSGLARGIDTAAHRAALSAGGRTIAVLGTPLSRVYPPENDSLQHTIMRDHLAVSQFTTSTPIRPSNFILRNRTMALISDASVIVESGEGGGSLSQGWEALRLGRPLFIHSHEFEKPDLKWPAEMTQYGAIRFSEPSDLADHLLSPSSGTDVAVSYLETT